MKIYIKKSIKDLLIDDIILHPIFRSDGLLFLSRYSVVTKSSINKLTRYFPQDVEVLVVADSSKLEKFEQNKVYQSSEFLKELKKIVNKFSAYISVKQTIEQYKDDRVEIDLQEKIETKPDIEEISYTHFSKFYHSPLWSRVEQLTDSRHLTARLKIIRGMIFSRLEKEPMIVEFYKKINNYHEVLKIHSINTAIISLVIGLSLELTDEQIIELATAAMFANIGFIKSQKKQYINYYHDNSDVDETLKHIRNSVEIIAESPFCRRRDIVMGILDHHENIDGSGLPNKKIGDEIHLYARIISIARLYDTLVGGYFGRTSLTPHQAFKVLWEEKGKHLDKQIIKIFMYRTNLFKLDGSYLLNDFQIGTIIGFSDFINFPLLPIVKFKDGRIIDLSKEQA
jgi:HD-GYP domain-containing protein (c-di-GMP phosphodiesterase class II)